MFTFHPISPIVSASLRTLFSSIDRHNVDTNNMFQPVEKLTHPNTHPKHNNEGSGAIYITRQNPL